MKETFRNYVGINSHTVPQVQYTIQLAACAICRAHFLQHNDGTRNGRMSLIIYLTLGVLLGTATHSITNVTTFNKIKTKRNTVEEV